VLETQEKGWKRIGLFKYGGGENYSIKQKNNGGGREVTRKGGRPEKVVFKGVVLYSQTICCVWKNGMGGHTNHGCCGGGGGWVLCWGGCLLLVGFPRVPR